MPIGIGDDHEELRRTVRRWIESHDPVAEARVLLEAEHDAIPELWPDLAAQGWLGLHVDDAYGGQGAGLLELAVALEELARAVTPGPALTTVLAAALVDASDDDDARKQLLPALCDGSRPAAVAFGLAGATGVRGVRQADGSLRLTGVLRPVLCGATTATVVAPVTVEDAVVWAAVDLDQPGVTVNEVPSLDPTRRVAAISVRDADVAAARVLTGVDESTARRLTLAIVGAECVGGARWCLDTAVQHAKDRRQFGRPIGQFQAIKHKLADMLVLAEQATALVWDACRAADASAGAGAGAEQAQARRQAELSATLAGAVALDTYVTCAKECVQVLGGMGFTWEHDAHVHLRRALTLRQLCGGTTELREDAARAALGGARRTLSTELPPEADARRETIRAEVADVVAAGEGRARYVRLADLGLINPHWPPPYGRSAGAVEQLVIDQELEAAGVRRPHLAVGAWALPTIIAHGTEEQQRRFVGPTLHGEITWCQLFSEPGAGSDLASLSTRATKVDGGWLLNGQKVWTSIAQRADYGICLARTNPDVPKHAGITYFLVDMHAEGIEVRPLREITGEAMFNEVFLTDVFVPDDCVVGDVNGGWKLARTTLANERVSMSSGATFGFGIEMILGWLAARPEAAADQVLLHTVGGMLGEAQAIALMGERTTLRSVSGVEPGPEASVRKLLGGEHEQRVQELGLALLGPEGATVEGDAAIWSRGFLSTRCLTIAGGTSEVQRNVIGERLLGLPKDPEPGA